MKKILGTVTRKFFCLLAKWCISRHRPFVIGITGSFGKTTARHVVTEVLRRSGKNVYTSEGNYNGEWGLALAVLMVRSGGKSPRAWFQTFLQAVGTILGTRYPQFLVLEYGVDHFGEMDIQLDVVEPDIALFTRLSPSHVVGFSSATQYYHEKQKLLRRKYKDTYAIGNGDDNHQSEFLCQTWYGTDGGNSDLVFSHIVEHPDGIEVDFDDRGSLFHVVSPILGSHHAGILAGAFLVAKKIGISERDILSFFRHIHMPHARGNVLRGLHDSLVIDGTYNGGFDPIVAGIEMLVRLAQTEGRNTIALIGDMRELGAMERERHEELWNKLKTYPIDHYIFVGAVCMEVIQPLIDPDWQEKTFFTLDSRVAGEYIRMLLAGSPLKYLLFAKGSQNTIYLEEALKYFIFPEEYLKLARQDDLYLRKKGDFYKMLEIPK